MRPALFPLMLWFLAAAGGIARANDLSVTVRTLAGAPVPNAVVTVYPSTGSYAPRPSPEPLVLAQEHIAFTPWVLVVPVGAQVSFPNHDVVRHHVYSFSAPHRFELKLYGRQERPAETFDKPGIVALGCNIHDRMSAYVAVVDTRFAGKTDADGVLRIADLPPGPAKVKVWRPDAKVLGGVTARSVTLAGPATQAAFDLDLRPPIPGKQDH